MKCIPFVLVFQVELSVMDIQSYTKYQNLTFVFAFEKHSCHPFVKEEMFPGNIKELQK